MRRLIATILGILGICCCCASIAAAAPREAGSPLDSTPFRGDRTVWSRSLGAARPLSFTSTSAVSAVVEKAHRDDSVEAIAYRISYAGVLLLSADRLVRSFDSLVESMQMNAVDGTNFRLVMEPRSRGFEVGIRLERPIGF